jgi:endonuclease/exonuclease/phosphatase family metal-dependent hydrolase
MKVLTLNTWQERGPWQKRWEAILKEVQTLRPDVAAFQEIFNREWAQEIQKQTAFPTLLFPEEFCGLAIYSNYSVLSSGVWKLPQSPLEEYARHAQWAELKVREKKLFVVNTHLSWKLEDTESRKKQVAEILKLVHEKAPTEPVILMGDLNATPHSPEIQVLTIEGRFHDLYHRSHAAQSGFTWDNRNPYAGSSSHRMPDRRIDYILARGIHEGKEHPVASCDVVFTKPTREGIWASDHFGLFAELK